MKRINRKAAGSLIFLLALLCNTAFFGCGGGGGSSDSETDSGNDSSVEATFFPEEKSILHMDSMSENTYFGYSVDISGDYAVVGANTDRQTNTVYISENGVQVTEIDSPLNSNLSSFGYSVSISGNYCLIGDPGYYDESFYKNLGKAYIYVRDDDGNWESASYGLKASTGGGSDYFGQSVNISGTYAIIGAPGEDYDDDSIINAGAAYIFEMNDDGSWPETETAILNASSEYAVTGANFGCSVGIDGNYAVVGAEKDSSADISNAGAAYVFKRDSHGNWKQKAVLYASDISANDYFGCSVSISGDYIIVGASGEDGGSFKLNDSGAAYIFEKDSSGNWNEVAILHASDMGKFDEFGASVSVSGSYAVVGSLYEDAGDLGYSGAGSAYVFERASDGTWIESEKIYASDRQSGDMFGCSVAIDSGSIIVGAYKEDGGDGDPYGDTGAVYIFE